MRRSALGTRLSVKRIHTFISPVFSVSALLFVAALSIAAGGGVAPDGPRDARGMILFCSFPISLIGLAIGTVLSVIKTVRYFRSRKHPGF
jgi:hypothetical protein